MKAPGLSSVLLLVAFAAGCVILPDDTPYTAERLSQLATAAADRQLVRKLFGQPAETRSGGEFWFYATVRERLGILGGPAGAVIEDYEWLAVQFDNAGRVVFHEFSDDNQGCLSNGICHIKGLFSELESKTVLTAPAVLDDQARQYRARSGECAVYFYQQPKIRLRAANYPVELFVDNRLYGITSYETYLFFTRPAGNIRLGAYQFEMDLNCLSGKAYYIKVVEGWTVKEGESLAIETDDAGIQAISKRRLALSE